MQMGNIGTRFLEKMKEIPRRIGHMPPQIGLHIEAFLAQLFPKRTKRRNGVDAWVVALLALQTAHLHHQRLGAAHLHTVDHVRNLHSQNLTL